MINELPQPHFSNLIPFDDAKATNQLYNGYTAGARFGVQPFEFTGWRDKTHHGMTVATSTRS